MLELMLLLTLNPLIGAAVLAAVDRNDALFQWYASADRMGAFGPFVRFITLQLWPIVVAVWLLRGRRG